MKRRSLVRSSLLFLGLLSGIFFIIISTATDRADKVEAAAPVQQDNPIIRFDMYRFGANGNDFNINNNDEVDIKEDEDDSDGDANDNPEIVEYGCVCPAGYSGRQCENEVEPKCKFIHV